ncbi:tyrosyl-DNA phosphodiesterase 2-like [Oratosquilla oratoria]|uniref:tyrosyl-DNA phosphodiesterase 2-like n=1 Tax=Oratosquilla oratoria TaxID=337810 RepID=UPI003F769069
MTSDSENVNIVDDEDNIPDRETCQKLVEQFAEVTGTDEACGQFYLQDRNWNLERSVNAFFEARSGGGVKVLTDGSEPELVVTFDSKMVSMLEKQKVSLVPPSTFKLLTWNIDGIEEHNLKKRTKAVKKIIEMENPDVVFLQELVPQTYSYLEEHLPQYMFVSSGLENYFNATLLRRTTIYFDGHNLTYYPNTRMGRSLLAIEAHIGDLKLYLLNTHLESTAEFAEPRMDQLRSCFSALTKNKPDATSILGGDLNLRDKEVTQVGLPEGVHDMWETCGSRKECKYTWDTLRNTNKEMGGKFKPRMRFDRVYLHQPKPAKVEPKHFGLVGIEKISCTQSFPSDHWGLVVYFEILRNGSAPQRNLNTASTSKQ